MLNAPCLKHGSTMPSVSCLMTLLFGLPLGTALLGSPAAPVAAEIHRSTGGSARSADSVEAYVRRFEASYHNVRTLRAEFAQTYYAWGKNRVESGTVELERGGKMRWDYREPESKLFVSDGKTSVLYVPAERQMTRSAIAAGDDARMPFSLLLSRLDLHKAFSKIEFADQALEADHGDRVLRAFPKKKFSDDYRSVLVELTPSMDIRRLVVLYPDNSTMQFMFSHVERNVPLSPGSFQFAPPAGTAVVQQ